MSLRRLMAVWTAIAVVGVLGGCSDGSPEVADPGRLPDWFMSTDRMVGATDTMIVGLERDGSVRGRAFDLATGEVRSIGSPPGADAYLLDAAFGSVHVTVVAYVSEEGPTVSTEEVELERRTFRLDPRQGEWSQVPLPEEVLAGGDGVVVVAHGDDGAALAAATRMEDVNRTVLMVLEGGRWRVVRVVPFAMQGRACATDDEWWAVTVGSTGVRFTATSFDDGTRRGVPLPAEVPASTTAVANLGCSRDRVAAVVVRAVLGPVDLVTATVGEDMTAQPSGVDIGVAGEPPTDGGATGPFIRLTAVNPEGPGAEYGEGDDVSLVVRSDGAAVPADLDSSDDRVIWRGRTSTVVVLTEISDDSWALRTFDLP